MRAVLDASFAANLLLPDENADGNRPTPLPIRANWILFVPVVFPYQIVHVIVKTRRRDRLDEGGVRAAYTLLESLPLRVTAGISEPRRIGSFLDLHGVNAYDSAYLELALRLELPLATTDAKLAEAARRAGVAVL